MADIKYGKEVSDTGARMAIMDYPGGKVLEFISQTRQAPNLMIFLTPSDIKTLKAWALQQSINDLTEL